MASPLRPGKAPVVYLPVMVLSDACHASDDWPFRVPSRRFNLSERKVFANIEPVSLRALNRRMAELLHYCELQKNNPRKAVLDEISELNVIRDELRRIQQRAAERPRYASHSLPKEFPTLDALLLRLNAVAQQIAKTAKNDPYRPELLNEITRLSLAADSFFKKEL